MGSIRKIGVRTPVTILSGIGQQAQCSTIPGQPRQSHKSTSIIYDIKQLPQGDYRLQLRFTADVSGDPVAGAILGNVKEISTAGGSQIHVAEFITPFTGENAAIPWVMAANISRVNVAGTEGTAEYDVWEVDGVAGIVYKEASINIIDTTLSKLGVPSCGHGNFIALFDATTIGSGDTWAIAVYWKPDLNASTKVKVAEATGITGAAGIRTLTLQSPFTGENYAIPLPNYVEYTLVTPGGSPNLVGGLWFVRGD